MFCFIGSLIRAHSFIGVQVFLGFFGAWFHAFKGLGLYLDFSFDPQSRSFNASMLEVNFVNSFFHFWRKEVGMKLFVKGYLLIKDAKELIAITY